MFNRRPTYSGREKELYQKKKRAREHMQSSSKIFTKELDKEKVKYSI